MKWFNDLESVGWIFWLVLFAVTAYPGYLLMKVMTYNTMSTLTRAGLGVFGAAIASGVLSAGINELLHRRQMKQTAERRKVERKDKRKRRK